MVVCPMFCCTHLYLPKRLWVEITARTALHQNPTDQKLMQYVCCYEFIIFFPPFSLSLGWLKWNRTWEKLHYAKYLPCGSSPVRRVLPPQGHELYCWAPAPLPLTLTLLFSAPCIFPQSSPSSVSPCLWLCSPAFLPLSHAQLWESVNLPICTL